MAHEIYTTKQGKKSMAYVGQKPWHGLGQKLTANASLDTWATEAGLDWQLLQAPVKFHRDVDNGLDLEGDFPANQVLYRSDTGEPLSVVSNRYKMVQPAEVLDFFADFVTAGDMTLETAGSINNGKKIWALARIGQDFNVNGIKTGKDLVRSYVLLASSCDKSIATTGTLTSVRVVCNNTLNLALNREGSSAIKVPHSRVFDAAEVKDQMGLVKESIDKNAKIMRRMHKLTVTDDQAMNFFLNLLKTPAEEKSGKIDIDSKRRAIPKIWSSYESAPGAEKTVWGLVNAVTHSVDYNPHARTDSARLNSAWFGAGAQQKTKAYAMASNENFLDAITEKTIKKREVKATNDALSKVLDMVDI